METAPQFPQSQFLTPKLGKGYNGVVYGISKGYAAKVSIHVLQIGHNSGRRQALNDIRCAIGRQLLEEYKEEYNIAADLYNAEISVPRPEGIYQVEIRWLETAFGLFFPEKLAFVMERIHGTQANKTQGDLRKRVEELHRLELNKCHERGFYSAKHLSLNDVVYDSNRNNIVFVDVGHFERV
ncbi:MAG: hypothetical protein AABX25_05135 [Nanoarchaeota archaeon]